MKKILVILSLAIAAFAAEQAPQRISRYVVNTNPINALPATEIRLIPLPILIDVITGKPVVRVSLEAWGLEDDGNGATNLVSIRSIILELTPAQVTAWYNAPDGYTFMKTAILAKTKLTEK